MRPIPRILLGAAILSLPSCLPTELCGCSPVPPPLITTDRDAYTATHVRDEGTYRQYGFTLIARFQNRTGDAIYLDRCYPDASRPIYGVELLGATRPLESGYDPVWACVGHDNPIVVQPGAERVDTLRITGPTSWDGRTGEAMGRLEGRFRLVYQASSCPREARCPLPEEMRRSNPFEVTVR